MGIKVKIGARESAIPPGDYKAKVAEISTGSFINKRRTFVFRFEIVEGEHQGASLRAFVNAQYEAFSAFSKLFKWYSVVMGEELEPGGEMDLDNFTNKVLVVRVETKESRKTKNLFSNVTEIKSVFCDL